MKRFLDQSSELVSLAFLTTYFTGHRYHLVAVVLVLLGFICMGGAPYKLLFLSFMMVTSQTREGVGK